MTSPNRWRVISPSSCEHPGVAEPWAGNHTGCGCGPWARNDSPSGEDGAEEVGGYGEGVDGWDEGEPEVALAASAEKAARRDHDTVLGQEVRRRDVVVDLVITDETHGMLTVCENGYGKRTLVSDYRVQGRGGQGLIDIRTTERNGKVMNLVAVEAGDDVMLITKGGQIVRTSADGISLIGRNTQGVRCINLKKDDKLVAAAKVPNEEEPPSSSAE